MIIDTINKELFGLKRETLDIVSAPLRGVTMVVQIVRFKSALTDEEVLSVYKARAPRYRQLSGLRQKFYVRFQATGEHGAVYIWENEEALAAFRQSELARTIPKAYVVQGTADILIGEVVYTLRPEAPVVRT